MPATEQVTLREIKKALATLDRLSRQEYGRGLEKLLLDPSPDAALRIQRLTGIALKRPFARPIDRVGDTQTKARRSWPWKKTSPEARAKSAPKEFKVLNELRMPGPWNDNKPLTGTAEDFVPISWDKLKGDADSERGLFKILVLYVEDKLNGQNRRTLKEYVEANESRRFEAGLDLATLVFDAGIAGPVAGLIGIPTLAVGITLVAIQYGYRKLTDTSVERVGDNFS